MTNRSSLRKIRRVGKIERDILEQLSLGDLAYGFLLSGRSTKRMRQLAAQRATDRYRRKQAIDRLHKCGCIIAGEIVSITPTGKKILNGLIKRNIETIGQRDWDRKWRVVAFDIPERHRKWRNVVRRLLKQAGFVQLQQSLWIFPHECEELVQLIKSESKLTKHILYGVFERIEGEARFRKIFKLN
jgi:hypothetical protein